MRKCWFFKQRSQKSRSEDWLVEFVRAVDGLPFGESAVAKDLAEFVSNVAGTSVIPPFYSLVS